MLKIVNNDGEELMRIHDNGEEEFADKKVKEQYEKAINEQKDDK